MCIPKWAFFCFRVAYKLYTQWIKEIERERPVTVMLIRCCHQIRYEVFQYFLFFFTYTQTLNIYKKLHIRSSSQCFWILFFCTRVSCLVFCIHYFLLLLLISIRDFVWFDQVLCIQFYPCRWFFFLFQDEKFHNTKYFDKQHQNVYLRFKNEEKRNKQTDIISAERQKILII